VAKIGVLMNDCRLKATELSDRGRSKDDTGCYPSLYPLR
jgi:hypothetical protein